MLFTGNPLHHHQGAQYNQSSHHDVLEQLTFLNRFHPLPDFKEDDFLGQLESYADLHIYQRSLKTGQSLYRCNEPLEAIYLVRSGSIKSVVLLSDGREQVTGFYMSGEVLGIDAIASGYYTTEAFALEESSVSAIPYEMWEQIGRRDESLQRTMYRMMSREIVRDQGMMLLLGTMNAEERLAAFLLNVSQRLALRGFSPLEFNLRMTREEIGSYLGLKLETVSRAFSKLQRAGLICVGNKHVLITDLAGLKRVINHRS